MFEDRLPYDDKYGILDPMLGDLVTLDGKSLYDYNADLIEYEPVVASVTSDVYGKVGKHSYILNRFSNGKNGIKLKFYVGGQNAQQAQINCNRVIGKLQGGIVTIVIGDTNFEYYGIMSSYTLKHTDVYNYYLLEVTMVAVKCLPEVLYKKVPDSEGKIYIYNEGVVSGGITIALESDLSQESVTVTCNSVSVTINNFSDYKYHIIDGLNGRVLCGLSNEDIISDLHNDDFSSYVNNFINTNLIEFPYISSGDNYISVSDSAGVSSITVKYYPLFVI